MNQSLYGADLPISDVDRTTNKNELQKLRTNKVLLSRLESKTLFSPQQLSVNKQLISRRILRWKDFPHNKKDGSSHPFSIINYKIIV